MLIDIVEVKVLKNYQLFLRFEDGVEGVIDISKLIPFQGVFCDLKDLNYFASVKLDKELGTIVWDNGADLSSSFLYSCIFKVA